MSSYHLETTTTLTNSTIYQNPIVNTLLDSNIFTIFPYCLDYHCSCHPTLRMKIYMSLDHRTI